jgi:flavorubredoxin
MNGIVKNNLPFTHLGTGLSKVQHLNKKNEKAVIMESSIWQSSAIP